MTVKTDDLNVNYFSLGNENAQCIVMLHGWGANIELFRNAAEFISSKYRVVAMDMPGFGDTPEPSSVWTVDDYTDFVIDFVAQLGIREAVFLGHSFGGRIIIKMANREHLPFVIKNIILVDSAGIRPEKSNEQKMKESVSKFGKKLLSGSPKLVEKLQSMSGSADYRAASPHMRKILVNVVNEDLESLLPGIKQSTLLIWGSADTATPISAGKRMEELIPDAGLAEISGVGHYSFIENPGLFNRIIASFLKL